MAGENSTELPRKTSQLVLGLDFAEYGVFCLSFGNLVLLSEIISFGPDSLSSTAETLSSLFGQHV